ncbi:PREDICTED: formin-like protein 7 [Ipomoea nil]|uniref:formin-like protein 7 n=1 Tax=Ipomoea nil TaxID=35883 RepID=UPI000900E750|nr:PREDICTED: formin-like protein 7 [Ipomoea nil]
MKLPKLTSFFLIFFFVSSFLAQARRLQENYEDELKKTKSSYQPLSYNEKLPAATGEFLLTLRLELPTSQDSQSFFERFNGVNAYMLTLSSLRSKDFGREPKSPPPSPKPSGPNHPTIIPSDLSTAGEFGRGQKSPPPAPEIDPPHHPTIIPYGLSSGGEFGREEKSPPPAPETDIPEHPTITTSNYGRLPKSPPPAPETEPPHHPTITTSSSYGRQARSPPPAPKPGPPIHPGNSGGGAQVISMADDSSDFLSSA